MLARRSFLRMAAMGSLSAWAACSRDVRKSQPKQLAIVASSWTYLSPVQQIGDRFLVGYPRDGTWHRPAMAVASLYVDKVDKKAEDDQSGARAAEFGFGIYPSVGESLRCGGSRISVDAVLVFPGQGMGSGGQPPRTDFVQQVTEVFESDGQAVPVYLHPPMSFAETGRMVEASRHLKFPLLAGSFLPFTWRLPPLELPAGCLLQEGLMVGIGSQHSDRFRALEAMQCMLERRRGGETGVKSVQVMEGPAVWKAGQAGRWSQELLEAALARSDSLQGVTLRDARPQDLANNGELPRLVKHPEAYLVEYSDGLRATLLMLNGAVQDFTFAARLQDDPRVQSTQFFIAPEPNLASSTCLVAQIEDLITSGQTPAPAERAWIVVGILERCRESKTKGHLRLETPELNLSYRASERSYFCDA